MKVLGIVGSYRKNGNTDLLVGKVLEGAAKHGLDTECLFLPDFFIRDCNGCEGCRGTHKCIVKDDMQKIYPLIEQADGIVTGSPTYFYNVTGAMKQFLDRLYCYEIFDEADRSVWIGLNELSAVKYAVTVSVCEQEKEEEMGYTSLAMRKTLEAVGYRVIENVKVFHMYAKGEVSRCEAELNTAFLAGERLAKTIRLRDKARAKRNG